MRRALFVLWLAACAPAAPVFEPVEVRIPVAAPCPVTALERPDFALRHVTPDHDLAHKTRAFLIELNQRRAYEAELEAQIDACRSLSSPF
jgi:hypothetical protein